MGAVFLKKHKKTIAILMIMAIAVASFGMHIYNASADNQTIVEINGYKISATAEGFRTIYSVSDPTGEVTDCGLVYGLEGYASETEIVVGSSNDYVYDYEATEVGKMDISYSSHENATSYAMTMKLIEHKDLFGTNMMIRAYAKLSDGSIMYSDVVYASVYSVAEYLYNNGKMSTVAGHKYLYDSILSVVNPNHVVVDYDWAGSIVTPEKITTSAPEVTNSTFVVENVEAAAGSDNVEVTISLLNNPGISSIGMNVTYDSSLTLNSITYNDEIDGQSIQPSGMSSPVKLIWVSPFADVTGDWTFVTLNFKVSDTVDSGKLPIAITYNADDVYDMTENNIDFDIINGGVTVVE